MDMLGGAQVKELFSSEKIAQRVRELGAEIKSHYKSLGEPLVLVGVLKGSIIFLSDLCRQIDLPLEIDMMGLSSYGDDTKSSGVVRISQDLTRPIKDKHVLIIEDIFDTGLSLKYLVENFKAREPKSIKICALLKKNKENQAELAIDFVGFNIPDDFVVGYGLDVAEKLRNLPMIGVYQS